MFRRLGLLVAPLALLVLFAGCKKSEGNKIENFFGATPTVTEVSLTKTLKHFDCNSSEDLCSSDICLFFTVNSVEADIDQLTATARVEDADGTGDLLVVVLRFLDPPVALPPKTTNQISLEMFDNGSDKLGEISGTTIPIISGDLVKGDGVYTRRFYFQSTTTDNTGSCVHETDFAANQGAFSVYGTFTDIDSGFSQDFTFNIEAIDREGNIGTSTDTTLAIQSSFVDAVSEPAGSCCRPEVSPPCPGC